VRPSRPRFPLFASLAAIGGASVLFGACVSDSTPTASSDAGAGADGVAPSDGSTGDDGARGGDGASGDGAPGECEAGAKECAGSQPRTCVGGHWQNDARCADDKPTCSGGQCVPPPSCASLLSSCGSPAKSCCASPVVDGDTFNRYDDSSLPATVSSVRLDLFEVTVARFRSFVATGSGTQTAPPAAGAGAHPKVTNSGWSSSYDAQLLANQAALESALTSCGGFANATYASASVVSSNNLPINCVTWFEAMAFCIWDGARLPSVAELELATRGGKEQRAFPWGSAPMDAAHADYCSTHTNPPTPNPCTSPDTAGGIPSVGSEAAGAGKWGHLDLFGSMREYALDIWTPTPKPCVDCVQLDTSSATTHAAIGGSWSDDQYTYDNLWNKAPSTSVSPRTPAGGFRCARDL
jgi:formylglycine-generating enzyme required for sulfatase activity